jgi:type I restriction enzyme M protein
LAKNQTWPSFEFHTQIDKLAKAGLLYLITEKFAGIDLHPEVVSNAQMGAVFEELIRKFAEPSNETAGEHFTPRDAIRLMVNLLFIEDDDALRDPDKTKVGYEIPFNRHFYVFQPPRPLAEIDAELKGVTDRILAMIGGLTK